MKTFLCKISDLKKLKLSKLREILKERLRFSKFIDSMLFFRLATNNREVPFENEQDLVAYDVM